MRIGTSAEVPSRGVPSVLLVLVLWAAGLPSPAFGDVVATKLSTASACAELLAATDLLRSGALDITSSVVVRQHLTDRHLRRVLYPDPFMVCRSFWQPSQRQQTRRRRRGEREATGGDTARTRIYSVKQLNWFLETADSVTCDAAQVLQTFQELHDVQHALSQLRGAWVARQREIRQQRHEERRVARQQRQQEVRRRRQQLSSAAAVSIPQRKVPRRTLLSNITDYDQDLEDDFFSELIEQVRLPTFTLEEYYEEEDETSDEENEADDAYYLDVPKAPIYSRRELQQELKRVRLARSLNVLAGMMVNVSSLDASVEAVQGGESTHAVWFSYSAVGPHWADEGEDLGLHVRISTVLVHAPRCPVEELHLTPIDQVTQNRYQRALERLWRLHMPGRDPVLHSFQQVPFPHCNVGDLQVMAMDVLHKRRSHKVQRYDPASRVVGLVLLPTPVCDLASLRERPLEEVIKARRRRSASAAIEPLAHQASTTTHPPPSQRSPWADALLRRRHAQEEGPREDDWPADEVEDQEAENLVLMPDERISSPQETLEATEAIVSTALRTDRSTSFHPFQVSRGDSERRWGSSGSNSGYIEPDDGLEAYDEAMDYEMDGTVPDNPSNSDVEPRQAFLGIETTAQPDRGAPQHPKLTDSKDVFEFVVPAANNNGHAETRHRKQRKATIGVGAAKEYVNDEPASSTPGMVDEIELREDKGGVDSSYVWMEHEIISNDNDSLAEVDRARLELHLHVEDELYRIETKLRDVHQELARLKKMRTIRERSEHLNARDISILRDGCDWSVIVDDFESIEGVELLWHSFRDSDESRDDSDDDQLLTVELELLREYNAVEAFAK